MSTEIQEDAGQLQGEQSVRPLYYDTIKPYIHLIHEALKPLGEICDILNV